DLPVACDSAQPCGVKPRRLSNCVHDEGLPQVGSNAIASPIPSDKRRYTRRAGLLIVDVADAMRPGIVCVERHIVAQALIGGKIEAVIRTRATRIVGSDSCIVLPGRRIL